MDIDYDVLGDEEMLKATYSVRYLQRALGVSIDDLLKIGLISANDIVEGKSVDSRKMLFVASGDTQVELRDCELADALVEYLATTCITALDAARAQAMDVVDVLLQPSAYGFESGEYGALAPCFKKPIENSYGVELPVGVLNFTIDEFIRSFTGILTDLGLESLARYIKQDFSTMSGKHRDKWRSVIDNIFW